MPELQYWDNRTLSNQQWLDYEQWLRGRIERGMAWLDQHHPGWINRIDIDRLDMGSSCACVLGQLAQSVSKTYDYANVVDENVVDDDYEPDLDDRLLLEAFRLSAPIPPSEARAMGFDITYDPTRTRVPSKNGVEEYLTLARAWTALILERVGVS